MKGEGLTIHCLVCGKEFVSLGKRYVDKDGDWCTPGRYYHGIECCDWLYNTEADALHHPDKRTPVTLHCITCGKPFKKEFDEGSSRRWSGSLRGYMDGQKCCSVKCALSYAVKCGMEFLDFLKLCPAQTTLCVVHDGPDAINKKIPLSELRNSPYYKKIKKFGAVNVRATKKSVKFDIYSPGYVGKPGR